MATKKKATKAKAAQPEAKAQEVAKPKAEQPKVERKRGGGNLFRELVIKHPDWDKAKVLEETNKQLPFAKSSADFTFAEVKAVLRILEGMGRLKA